MRILRLISSLDPRVGGPAVAALNSAFATARVGVRTDIAAIVPRQQRDATWWRDVQQRCEGEGVRTFAFDTDPARRELQKYNLSSSVLTWLASRAPRYDVVHADSPWTGAGAGSIVAAIRGVPVVISPHEVFTPSDMGNGTAFTKVAKRVGVVVFSRAADVIACSSELEMRDAAAVGIPMRRLSWLYHPVVDERVPSIPRRRESHGGNLRIGYIGRLHEKKNVDLLIDAVGLLRQQGRSMSLLIAGAGAPELDHALRERARQRLGSFATFLGWVEADRKPNFFSRIDVLAMPSSYECFGVAAVEGLAAGLPVVVSDRVGIAPIVAQHQAGAVVSPDRGAVADALLRYASDRRELLAAADRAPTAAAETSFGEYGRRAMKLYEEVLARRRD